MSVASQGLRAGVSFAVALFVYAGARSTGFSAERDSSSAGRDACQEVSPGCQTLFVFPAMLSFFFSSGVGIKGKRRWG